MRKMLLSAVAILSLGVGAAHAANVNPVVGQPPLPSRGPGLVDGTWLNGLAGGMNMLYQNGLTAAGTNQATAFPIQSGIALVEFSTVASGTGANLPTALPGQCVIVFNHGANTLTVYPAVRNNPVTGGQDTIAGATSATITTAVGSARYCAGVAGKWN